MGFPQQLVSMLKTHEKASDILGNVWVEIRISMHSETDVARLKTEPREALAIAKTDRSVILPASLRLINGMVSKKREFWDSQNQRNKARILRGAFRSMRDCLFDVKRGKIEKSAIHYFYDQCHFILTLPDYLEAHEKALQLEARLRQHLLLLEGNK